MPYFVECPMNNPIMFVMALITWDDHIVYLIMWNVSHLTWCKYSLWVWVYFKFPTEDYLTFVLALFCRPYFVECPSQWPLDVCYGSRNYFDLVLFNVSYLPCCKYSLWDSVFASFPTSNNALCGGKNKRCVRVWFVALWIWHSVAIDKMSTIASVHRLALLIARKHRDWKGLLNVDKWVGHSFRRLVGE